MPEDPPRLLLISPPLDDPGASGRFSAALTSVAEIGVAALLLRGGTLDDRAFGKVIEPVAADAQSREIAVLLEDRPALLADSGADGLHVTLAERKSPLKELRRRFGDDVILGAGCGASRHLAMTAGEQGADYIGFGALDDGPAADPEMIAWWEAVMTPPQVAFGARDLAQARELAAAGPDFLALCPALWLAGGEPASALRRVLAAFSDDA